jgi:protein-tyrosine phosphatase
LARERAKIIDRLSEIVPGLFVGSYAGAKDVEKLRARRITHLLSVREEPPEGSEGFASLHLPMFDSGESRLEAIAGEAAVFIDAALGAGGGVLVFCDLGVNRSPALIAGYLIMKGWTLEAALTALLRGRTIVGIVEPYLVQLRALAARG